jgi:hypothetical protein
VAISIIFHSRPFHSEIRIETTENKIVSVIEASTEGRTHHTIGRMAFQGTMKDAEIFFGNKQFDLSKIEDYKQQ